MRILRFNEVDRQRAAGQTGDGQRERRPGHPAADDQHALRVVQPALRRAIFALAIER